MAKRPSEAEPVQRHRFTVDEYFRMGEAGVFAPDDRVELLDGEIFEMTPIGTTHAGCVNALEDLFRHHLRRRAIVAVQNPAIVSQFSAPQPDLCLLRPRADFYRRAHPRPADILLVVEVSNTSLPFDRTRKAPAYAAAGIAETWIVDLEGDTVLVHRRPTARGYRVSAVRRRGDSIAPLAFPTCRLAVSAILG